VKLRYKHLGNLRETGTTGTGTTTAEESRRRTSLKMNKLSLLILLIIGIAATGCNTNNLVDVNSEMPKRNWSYVNTVKASANITDPAKPFMLYFKLRHTAEYRYSNIFVLLRIKDPHNKTQTKRYEFRLAQADGQWLGSGSGNLFTYKFRLLSDYHFPKSGKYEFEIEQNMRDNPLKEVSDAGLTLAYQ
jgi:gliding motility-associated lipoprotein GldH